MKLPGSLYKLLFGALIFFCADFYISAQEAEKDNNVSIVPIQVTVRDGRTVRRDMIYSRINNAMEIEAYSGKEIEALLKGLINNDSEAVIADMEWLTPQILESAGIKEQYDSALISSDIFIPSEIQPVQNLSASGTRELPDYQRASPAFLSAALPYYISAGTVRIETDSADYGNNQTVYGLNLFPAVSAGGTLLSSELLFENRENEVKLEEWEAALSRDIANSIRITAGTTRIDPLGFQTSSPVFGFGVEKRDGIGGTPVLADRYHTAFNVDTESTADIYVNGRLIRSMRIFPGSYELSDFPLVPGYNIVSVIITDIYGESRTVSGSVSHSPRLLPPGESAWGVSTGTADENDFILSRGYHRLGISNYFGTEIYGEMTDDKQLAGLTLLAAGRPGLFELGGAGAVDQYEFSKSLEYALRGSYSFYLSGRSWLPSAGISALFRTAEFSSPGAFTDSASASSSAIVPPWVFTASVNQPLPLDSSLLYGYRYTVGRNDLPDTSGLYAFFALPIGEKLSLRLGTTVDYDGSERVISGLITLGTVSEDRKRSFSSTYYPKDNEIDINANQRFTGEKSHGAVGLSVTRIDHQEGTVQGVSGTVQAGSSIVEASAAVMVRPAEDPLSGNPEQIDIRGRAGSGIYFADGIFGIGRPSNSSFALIAKSSTLPEGPLMVNPSGSGAEASSGIIGVAVITSLPDYYEKPVNIELPDLPMDYSLDSTSFIIETGYRTGTAIRIDGSRLLYGSGQLIKADGEPVKLRVFQIKNSAGEVVMTSFTDERGFFYIYDMRPGNYVIDFSQTGEGLIRFNLSDSKEPPFDLGGLLLSVSGS